MVSALICHREKLMYAGTIASVLDEVLKAVTDAAAPQVLYSFEVWDLSFLFFLYTHFCLL